MSGHHSDVAGGARWVRQGAQGAEGFDTTAALLTSAVRAVGPTTITVGTTASFCVIFTMNAAPSGVGIIVLAEHWQLEVGQNSGDRYDMSINRAGYGTTRKQFGASATSSGLNCVAVTMSGTSTKFSLNGAAVQTLSHVSGSASGSAVLGASSSSFPAPVHLTSLVLWSSTIGDSDLVVLSGSAASGRIPKITGATEMARWHCSQASVGGLVQELYPATYGPFAWTAAPVLSVR